MLKNFNSAADAKTKALEEIIAGHSEVADAMLADLRAYTTTAKTVVNQIQEELRNGARELKRIRDDSEAERRRMEQTRTDYESRNDAMDWVVFILLLLAMIGIGTAIGWRWH